MKRILVVGGSNGIGLAIATLLAKRTETEKVYIVDKSPLADIYKHEKIESHILDLTSESYEVLDEITDIDGLIITAGFGRLALFEDIEEKMIPLYFQVNTIGAIRTIKHYYNRLLSRETFRCCVMVSIAGFMSSPFFSVYGASKAALKIFIESVNVELEKAGTSNRILNVSPGSIKGTSFSNKATDLDAVTPLAEEILKHLDQGDDLFIPKYEEVFKEVLRRYHEDFRKEGLHSYDYKIQSGRVNK